MSQLSLFPVPNQEMVAVGTGLDYSLAIDDTINQLLAGHAPVAVGVSGGKDSSACAWAVNQYLDRIGHAGPRLLIHADLGLIEWLDSAAICRRLADQLNWPLVTVSRQKGGMVERWQQRWNDNVRRYKALSCVSLILPWSTPTMRFCTSELKTAVICQELTRRFPGQTIVSVTGVRRAESKEREDTPIQQAQPRMKRKRQATTGIDWNPLVDWSVQQVWAVHKIGQLPVHEAYTRYGCSRVSCSFCIMSSVPDLLGALKAEHNHQAFSELVDLENRAGFSFKRNVWLGSLAPELLTPDQQQAHRKARLLAARREALQSRLPGRIRFTKGGPTEIIRYDDAQLLAEVRRATAQLYGWEDMGYVTADAIRERYEQLMAERVARTATKRDNRRHRTA